MKSEIPNGTKDGRNTNSCYCQQLYVCNNSYSFSSVIYTENCSLWLYVWIVVNVDYFNCTNKSPW